MSYVILPYLLRRPVIIPRDLSHAIIFRDFFSVIFVARYLNLFSSNNQSIVANQNFPRQPTHTFIHLNQKYEPSDQIHMPPWCDNLVISYDHCILFQSNLPNLFFLISSASSFSGVRGFAAGLIGVVPRGSRHYRLALSAPAVH